jgi:glycosyltransferase involved in cell wall biosynthesis
VPARQDHGRDASSGAQGPIALVICPVLPYPPSSGGRKRTLRLLEAMERSGVTPWLITVDRGPAGASDALRARGWSVDVVPDGQQSAAARVVQHLRRRPSPYLSSVATRLTALRAQGARLVQVEHPQSAYYERALAGLPSVLSAHNVDSEIWKGVAASHRPLTSAWARGWSRWQAMRAAERRAARLSDAVLCVSERDAAYFERFASEIAVVPNGVDNAFFASSLGVPAAEHVLFFGEYTYAPNLEGMRRFIREGWPALAAARPAARLRLAGTGMPAGLARVADAAQRIDVLGFVDDLVGELEGSRLVVVPLWQGGGTRLKVVEALAAGRPVVGTALGVEGVGFRDGVHGALAETPGGLAAAAARLLADPDWSAQAAVECRRLAERFRWERVTQPAERLYARWST